MSEMQWLDCPSCGSRVFGSREPLWCEGDQETCRSCGALLEVAIDDYSGDDDAAFAGWAGAFADVGQPHCNLSCGAHPDAIGDTCSWRCERTATAVVTVLTAATGATPARTDAVLEQQLRAAR